MATLTYAKFNSFVEAVAEKKHNLATDQLKVALTNTAPVAANSVYADLTAPLATTNLSGATPFNITTTSSSQTAGTYSLVLVDLTLTATGSVGPFRYIVIYNDTATNDELIGYYDIGSNITLANGESYLLDFSEAQTLLTIA
jgi:hypothetical protein